VKLSNVFCIRNIRKKRRWEEIKKFTNKLFLFYTVYQKSNVRPPYSDLSKVLLGKHFGSRYHATHTQTEEMNNFQPSDTLTDELYKGNKINMEWLQT
jgi:hypothetical protein